MLFKSIKNRLVIIAAFSAVLLPSCLEDNSPEISETEVTMQNLVVSNPAIWNTLSTQSISFDQTNEKSASASLKRYPTDTEKYYYTIFEDLFPGEGDYDFNDIMLKSELEIGEDNGLVKGTMRTNFIYIGGNLTKIIGLLFYEIDSSGNYKRITNSKIKVNGNRPNGDVPYFFPIEKYVEWRCDKGVCGYRFKDSEGENMVKMDDVPAWETEFEVELSSGKDIWINYFIGTSHSSYYKPSDKFTYILTAGFDDIYNMGEFSIPNATYLTKDKKPWGLEIEAKQTPIVREKVDFCNAYPNFIKWINNPDDPQYKNWYETPDRDSVYAAYDTDIFYK